jgi:hypothetical protein
MIKVKIICESQVTNQASFPTMEEAQAWLASHEGMGTVGHKDIFSYQEVLISEEVRGPVQVLVSEATFDSYGDEVDPAVYSVDPDGIITPAVYQTQAVLVSPAQYTVEIVDITAQLAAEVESVAALAYLAATDYIVVRAMERGEALSVEFKAERDAARLKVI